MKRVFFIAGMYEIVHFIEVEAETNVEAFRKAMDQYEAEGYTEEYDHLEVEEA